MFCPKCGAENEGYAKSCRECKEELPETLPRGIFLNQPTGLWGGVAPPNLPLIVLAIRLLPKFVTRKGTLIFAVLLLAILLTFFLLVRE